MSWLGAGIGALLGARGGILYSLAGAALGSWVEDRIRQGSRESKHANVAAREPIILAAISAMLAKVAKVDGRITLDEVHCCEHFFDQLGLQGEKRAYCIRVFQNAKNDSHSIYQYATSFAQAQDDPYVREIVYGVLWDLACVDGKLSEAERNILYQLPGPLCINPGLFAWHARRHGINFSSNATEQEEDPYAILGCKPSDTDDTVRKCYRKKAKCLHPDVLRAQGLSEELLGKANDQMARINAAWSEIKKARGL